MAPTTAKQRATDRKPGTEASPRVRGDYIFLVQMDIPKELEDDFNRLYDTEHIPLISKVPGVRHCERYVLETSENEHMPRYAAIYEVDSPAVLTSDAWKEASDTGDWKTVIRPYARNRQRSVFRRIT
jgi:hypothetical protein